MTERSAVIIGLPASGKTTYLAALWHVVTAREVDTALEFGDLRVGDFSHLNAIAARWRSAIVQERTAVAGRRLVSMNLLDRGREAVRITFPDLPGEVYRDMWEGRECSAQIAEILRAGEVLLFVHSDNIRAPNWIVDEVSVSQAAGLKAPNGKGVSWDPRHSPTQVQLVDLLQLFRMPPLDVGCRRLAVMLSAWDKASGENLTPQGYLEAKLPLLNQYLRRGADGWTWRVYGISAQGGEYDRPGKDADRLPQAEELRCLQLPSMRIQIVGPEGETHDLTEPLIWLMG